VIYLAPIVELNATAKAILGMIAARPRSGYEIKQLVDKSTRFFWAASYGRIYPELKRLDEERLIEGTDSSQGARARTVYKLTAKGKRAAREWIDAPSEVQNEEHPPYTTDEGSTTVLRFGIELNEWIAGWFERAASELEQETAKPKKRRA